MKLWRISSRHPPERAVSDRRRRRKAFGGRVLPGPGVSCAARYRPMSSILPLPIELEIERFSYGYTARTRTSSATPKAASFKWGYPPTRNVRAALKIAGATASMSFSRRCCRGTRSPSSGFTPVSHACTTAGESCSLRVRAS